MCLYPRYIDNRKYRKTKKNGGNVPELKDIRVSVVPVGCGQCIECRQQKARAWQVRMHEELKASRHAYFVTLSFSPQAIQDLQNEYKIKNVNELATKAMRLYLERWRKKYKKSQRHWFVTELGHTNTERIHLHGIVFLDDEDKEDITKIWKYGNTWIGDYCTAKTINYIVKYIYKLDEIHKLYKSIVLCSPGIGKNYVNDTTTNLYAYNPCATIESYRLDNGNRVNLPIYYRNKFFNEEERERLWLEKLDKQEIYVRGRKFKVDSEEHRKEYEDYLQIQQDDNNKIGFGNPKWKLEDYKITTEMLNTNTRTKTRTRS